jgi:DNA-binding CsgD family transcriptional regulator
MIRTCHKCGADFETITARTVCLKCRAVRDKPAGNGTRKPAVRGETSAPKLPLTFRENQLVCLLMGGLTNKEIALEMRLSVGTIKEYLNTIFQKVGLYGPGSRNVLMARIFADPSILKRPATGIAGIPDSGDSAGKLELCGQRGPDRT